jgi:hypothetical protein
MPENLFGLPTHVLLQHVVVVLLPLAAVAAILVALWGWYRHHLGIATLVATFLTTLAVPLTTQSGESLAERLPDSQAIADHVAAGDRVLWVAAVFGLCLFAVVVLDLRRRAADTDASLAPAEAWLVGHLPASWRAAAPGWTSALLVLARVLLVLAALAVFVVVIQAGHTGAHAVWSDYPDLQP